MSDYNTPIYPVVNQVLTASYLSTNVFHDIEYFRGALASQTVIEMLLELQLPSVGLNDADARLRHDTATNALFLLEGHTANTAFANDQYVRQQFGRHDDTASFERWGHVKFVRTGANQGKILLSPYSATVGEGDAELFELLNTGQMVLNAPAGVAPFSIPNTTEMVTGLNAELWQGMEPSAPLRSTFTGVVIGTTDTIAASIDLTGLPAGSYLFELWLYPTAGGATPSDDHLATVTCKIQPASGAISGSFNGSRWLFSSELSSGKPSAPIYSDAVYPFDGTTDPVINGYVIKAGATGGGGAATCRGLLRAHLVAPP